jgi:hypothetical protein
MKNINRNNRKMQADNNTTFVQNKKSDYNKICAFIMNS